MKKICKICLFIFLVVLALSFVSVQPSFSGSLKFVQLSDIHYDNVKSDKGYKLLSKSQPLLEDAISQINQQKNVDFVMLTGDVIDKPKKDSLYDVIKILNTLNRPWYYVLGNHDCSPDTSLNKHTIVKILKEKNENFIFNSTYYTFKPKRGFRVIVLDGTLDNSANGNISQNELLWLDSVLKKSKNDVVLIFMHFPIIQPFDSPVRKLLNPKELTNVLKKYDMPIALFSGHYHSTKITKSGNILYVSTPSLISYPNAFRMVTVKNKRKQAVFKFDFLETGLKDFQAKARILVLGGKVYYGKSYDRNAVVIIDKK